MTFAFRPATRQDSKVLIGLYGESGCGKTYSALMLARGLAGNNGKVAMIDTESGRGALYADIIPGGYLHMEMAEPFSPQRYIDAITAAESAGVDALIIDSMSHEWEGLGGVTAMAADISKARADRYNKAWDNVIQFGDWKEPKMQHQRLMLKLLQTKLNVICCLRAKYKSRQVKNDKGKSEVVKDDHTTPIQADEFIYEMTAHMEIMQNHTIRITKCSHPDLAKCFDNGKPLSIQNGQRIAAWAKGKAAGAVSPSPAAQLADELDPDLQDAYDDFIQRLSEAHDKAALETIAAEIKSASWLGDARNQTLRNKYAERFMALQKSKGNHDNDFPGDRNN